MARANDMIFDEYAAVFPLLLELEAAVDQSNWDGDDWEAYGEQIAEIGSERALAGMRDSAMSDARRIWAWKRKQSTLRYIAETRPLHRDAALDLAQWMPL
jgi:hypothetical protein